MKWDIWQTDRFGTRTRCLEQGLDRKRAEELVDRDYLGVKRQGGHYQILKVAPSKAARRSRKPKLVLVGVQPHAPAGRRRWERSN